MATWHRLGDRSELSQRLPYAVKLERWSVPVFLYDRPFRAIRNTFHTQGGPASRGPRRGEGAWFGRLEVGPERRF